VRPRRPAIFVRNTRHEDFDQIIDLTRLIYPDAKPWRLDQLDSHLRVFPAGQFVAVESSSGAVLGVGFSLQLRWDDYDMSAGWRDFTDHGMFTNHNPAGRTLYGAEVMTHPGAQRRGVGSKIYKARRELAERLELKRIRAAARLPGYHKYAAKMSAEEYVLKVVKGTLRDPTLSFQLKHGFEVISVIPNYLHSDPESLGYAALIEWINTLVATPADLARRDAVFRNLGR
jgi:GNAT superfamily N-acetyltransferase